jgi:hypothetical protein
VASRLFPVNGTTPWSASSPIDRST